MEKLRVGLVGAGSIAQVAHLPILAKHPDIDLVAVCDTDDGKMKSLTAKFDIPKWYYVYDKMLKNENLDALVISTPSVFHYPMAYMALKKGVHVFVEKPVALKLNDAEKLEAQAKKGKLSVMVGMQNRFRSDVKILKEFIQKGELGEIFYIKTGWLKRWNKKDMASWHSEKKSSGGGVLMDMGIPLLDLVYFIMDFPKIKKIRLYDYYLNPDIDVEDAALAIIEMKSGMTITVEISWRMFLKKDTVYTHVFGKKGAAKLNPLRVNKTLYGNLVNVSPLDIDQNTDFFKTAYKEQINNFVKTVRGEEPNHSSIADAIKIMRIIEALYESAKRGEEIVFS